MHMRVYVNKPSHVTKTFLILKRAKKRLFLTPHCLICVSLRHKTLWYSLHLTSPLSFSVLCSPSYHRSQSFHRCYRCLFWWFLCQLCGFVVVAVVGLELHLLLLMLSFLPDSFRCGCCCCCCSCYCSREYVCLCFSFFSSHLSLVCVATA